MPSCIYPSDFWWWPLAGPKRAESNPSYILPLSIPVCDNQWPRTFLSQRPSRLETILRTAKRTYSLLTCFNPWLSPFLVLVCTHNCPVFCSCIASSFLLLVSNLFQKARRWLAAKPGKRRNTFLCVTFTTHNFQLLVSTSSLFCQLLGCLRRLFLFILLKLPKPLGIHVAFLLPTPYALYPFNILKWLIGRYDKDQCNTE